MSSPRSLASIGSKITVGVQLVCVTLGIVVLVHGRAAIGRMILAELLVLASVAGLVTIVAWRQVDRQHRGALAATRSMEAQREHSLALERAVASRAAELEDAQRVLQRMWWLGQQITLELHPHRVLERFLEAVVDIAQAEIGTVGLLGDDGMIRIVVGTGLEVNVAGASLPLDGSAMGRVIQTGTPLTIANLDEHRAEIDGAFHARVRDEVTSIAVVPIVRRGERIGAVTVGTARERVFTPADLERMEAMGDLLALSLDNAELVEALRQTEWRFRTLFRAAPDAVLTVLSSGHIREANDAVRDVTGFEPSHVVGQALEHLVSESDRDRLHAALEATFAGTPSRVEVSFQHADHARGTPVRRIVALAMRRMPEADPPSVLLVGRDMTTEREMRVRLMESDRLAAVGELVAGVAHEVNNPLSSISAFAQLLLRESGLTPAQRDSIEVIRAETVRASQVVKDLLAFARRSEPQREPLDLNGVLQRTLRLRAYQLSSNRIGVETDFAAELPAVIGDARQLQQVCLNLVTNAIQAMATLGGGTLFVTTRADGQHVTMEMRDTGPGIPDPVKAHIFEPFFTTKEEGEGTGLGLSVSYGIVTAHGGVIDVPTTSSAGTVFRVVLPAALAPTSGDERASSVGLPLRSPLAGIRLLFVDDEPMLRSSMQAFGDLRGITVLTARDGIEALEMARTQSVDAIVCDLRMPGMDGPAFHERLRHERPGLAARTVFITGDVVTQPSRSAPIRQPVLAKPFAFEKLEETLVSLIRGGIPATTPAGWA
jgi:two-component system NtrC family sensor kinase